MLTSAQIRAARAFLNMSQTDFAKACDIARSTLASHEQGLPITVSVSAKITEYSNKQGLKFENGGVIEATVNVDPRRSILDYLPDDVPTSTGTLNSEDQKLEDVFKSSAEFWEYHTRLTDRFGNIEYKAFRQCKTVGDLITLILNRKSEK